MPNNSIKPLDALETEEEDGSEKEAEEKQK